MYIPIPGMSHLQLYAAPQRIRYEREPTAGDLATREEIRGLVVIVVEVAASLRPLSHLDNARLRRKSPRTFGRGRRLSPLMKAVGASRSAVCMREPMVNTSVLPLLAASNAPLQVPRPAGTYAHFAC
ncbi:hypothetical protein [Corynebacterium minutissimum]|uniref:Uncharacterized protein n=1 Tax=Corynebacterium minutissimum TaxID=38301 RepID=A0A2X4UR23_9CORY|nr:hypothetical protein [Corynebacterium minutissimum]SQI00534.1 Uncharacterised protein [Corynebacterium minutissimum]VEG05398.1 Uncharacterised protein [Corynebacterium minutissimum]